MVFGLALAVLGTVAVQIVLSPPPVGMDDANIGFRYARNLAEGQGFVFNPGGEHVEGVTSLLWVFILAGIYWVAGPSGIEAGGLAFSVLFTGVALAVVLRMLASFSAPGRWAGIVWLVSLPAFYQWAGLAIMDTALWSAALHLFFVVCLNAARGRAKYDWTVVAAVLGLVLSRPDSMLVVPATLLVLVITFGLTPAVRRTGIVALGTAVPVILGLTLVRLAYFGYPLPNTYYTKVSPDLAYRLAEGFRYVGSYFLAHPMSLLPVAVVVGLTADALRPLMSAAEAPKPSEGSFRRRLALAAGLFAAIGFASAVVVGGDHFFDHRFLQPYVPLLALPLAWGAAWIAKRVPSARSLVVTLVAVVAAVLFMAREWRIPYRSEAAVNGYVIALEGRMIGAALWSVLEDTPPVLGVWQAGGLGYGYLGPVRDLLGLNWVAMGHSPGDRKGIRDHAAFHEETFWAAPPDLMIPISLSVVESVGCPRRVWENTLKGVMTTPRFEQAFEPVLVRPSDGDAVFAYGRTAWLDENAAPVQRVGWAACGVSAR